MAELETHVARSADWQSVYSFDNPELAYSFLLERIGLPTVRWHPKLIDWLSEEFGKSAGESGPVWELGGILLGTIEPPSDSRHAAPEISVSWFLPMPMGALRINDTAMSERIVAAGRGNLSVVGIYKTQESPASELRQEDWELAQAFLTSPEQIFLVVHTDVEGESTAGIFFPCRTDHPEEPAVVFPFDGGALEKNEDEEAERFTMSFRPAEPPSWRRPLVVTVAACLLAAGGVALFRSRNAAVSKRVVVRKPESLPAKSALVLTGTAESSSPPAAPALSPRAAPKQRIFKPIEQPIRPVQKAAEAALLPPPPTVLPAPLPTAADLLIAPPALPLSSPTAKLVYSAPQSETRVFPRMPASLGRLLTANKTIRVKVAVDQEGNVSGAQSLDQADGIEKALSQLAEAAALRWHFVPARRNGSVVASDTVVEFRFTAKD